MWRMIFHDFLVISGPGSCSNELLRAAFAAVRASSHPSKLPMNGAPIQQPPCFWSYSQHDNAEPTIAAWGFCKDRQYHELSTNSCHSVPQLSQIRYEQLDLLSTTKGRGAAKRHVALAGTAASFRRGATKKWKMLWIMLLVVNHGRLVNS